MIWDTFFPKQDIPSITKGNAVCNGRNRKIYMQLQAFSQKVLSVMCKMCTMLCGFALNMIEQLNMNKYHCLNSVI